MATRADGVNSSGFIVRDEIDELFGAVNPNPERTGCLPTGVLSALARHLRPIDDPAYEHLVECSPCYQEFRGLQEQQGAAGRPASDRTWRVQIAAAAILLLLATGLWWYVRSREPGSQPVDVQQQQPTPVALRATLDLRPFAVPRKPGEASGPTPVVLPRGRVSCTILLAVGSEPGPYQVEIRDPRSRVVAAASSQAQIRNFVTTLEATLDLEAVRPGPYELAIRREGDDWRLFPSTIK